MERPPPILVVDDDSDDRFMMRTRLRVAGIANPILLCADGEAAVAQFNRIEQISGSVPAAVLLDIRMPRRGGFAVLDWIRRHRMFREVPVVVVTGSTHAEDRGRALALGATAYRQKFPSPTELAEVLRGCHGIQRKETVRADTAARSIMGEPHRSV